LGTTDRNEADQLGRALLAALLQDEEVTTSGAVTLRDLWERYKRNSATFLDNSEKSRLDDTGRAQVLFGFFRPECDVTKLTEHDQRAYTKTRLAGGIVSVAGGGCSNKTRSQD
jgi:hypothetical protein